MAVCRILVCWLNLFPSSNGVYVHGHAGSVYISLRKNSYGKVHNINNDHTCGFSVMPGQSYGEVVSWMDSTEEEVTVWMSMIENPNHWIDATLPIRTNLTRRSE